MKCDTLGFMGSQACMLSDECYKCGGGNINCQWQTSGGLCKPSRAQTAPWLLDLQDGQRAGTDLPSKLSLAMDTKCVFVCGLGRVLPHHSIDMVEAGIIRHACRWDPQSRLVVRVRQGHAFIFFHHANQRDSFLHDAAVRGTAWGSITVCNNKLGVKSFSADHWNGSAHGAASRAAIEVPSSPVAQPTNPPGTAFGAMQAMAQRVHTPVGGGYGTARQVVRVVVDDAVLEDMTARNFDWSRANVFLKLQPDGMSRVCSLCGSGTLPIRMPMQHEEGGANKENRRACLIHLYKLGHTARVAAKQASLAATTGGQQDANMGQSDGTYMLHSIVHTRIATSHSLPHDPLCR